jgi:phospholipase/lecithinase/hemolysin
MTKSNPQVYFLNKILEHQYGKNTLVFLAGTNEILMTEEVNKKGYQENLQRINDYFKDKPVEYINFQGKIDENYFSDHVHLTAEGHRWLAEILYSKVIGG